VIIYEVWQNDGDCVGAGYSIFCTTDKTAADKWVAEMNRRRCYESSCWFEGEYEVKQHDLLDYVPDVEPCEKPFVYLELISGTYKWTAQTELVTRQTAQERGLRDVGKIVVTDTLVITLMPMVKGETNDEWEERRNKMFKEMVDAGNTCRAMQGKPKLTPPDYSIWTRYE